MYDFLFQHLLKYCQIIVILWPNLQAVVYVNLHTQVCSSSSFTEEWEMMDGPQEEGRIVNVGVTI